MAGSRQRNIAQLPRIPHEEFLAGRARISIEHLSSSHRGRGRGCYLMSSTACGGKGIRQLPSRGSEAQVVSAGQCVFSACLTHRTPRTFCSVGRKPRSSAADRESPAWLRARGELWRPSFGADSRQALYAKHGATSQGRPFQQVQRHWNGPQIVICDAPPALLLSPPPRVSCPRSAMEKKRIADDHGVMHSWRSIRDSIRGPRARAHPVSRLSSKFGKRSDSITGESPHASLACRFNPRRPGCD